MVDAEQALDILAFAAALIVEYNPETATPQRLRLHSESIGRWIFEHAKAIRAESEKRGRPVIEAFGAGNRMTAAGTA